MINPKEIYFFVKKMVISNKIQFFEKKIFFKNFQNFEIFYQNFQNFELQFFL